MYLVNFTEEWFLIFIGKFELPHRQFCFPRQKLSRLVNQMGFIIMGSNWTSCHLPTCANSKLCELISHPRIDYFWRLWTLRFTDNVNERQWHSKAGSLIGENYGTIIYDMLKVSQYLGIQFGGVLSTSQVANSFIGTGFNPTIGGGLPAFSAMFTQTKQNSCTCSSQSAQRSHACKLTKIPAHIAIYWAQCAELLTADVWQCVSTVHVTNELM